jgi:hypothetical protein
MYLLRIRETLHVGQVGQFSFVLARHQIFEFACYIPISVSAHLHAKMLYQPEKVSLLTRVKEQSFSGAFLALVLLAMAGWIYLLGSMFVKFVLWCFS